MKATSVAFVFLSDKQLAVFHSAGASTIGQFKGVNSGKMYKSATQPKPNACNKLWLIKNLSINFT
jgi:hypothetical protein